MCTGPDAPIRLRDLLDFSAGGRTPVALGRGGAVHATSCERFNTGAMSYGSICRGGTRSAWLLP